MIGIKRGGPLKIRLELDGEQNLSFTVLHWPYAVSVSAGCSNGLVCPMKWDL